MCVISKFLGGWNFQYCRALLLKGDLRTCIHSITRPGIWYHFLCDAAVGVTKNSVITKGSVRFLSHKMEGPRAHRYSPSITYISLVCFFWVRDNIWDLIRSISVLYIPENTMMNNWKSYVCMVCYWWDVHAKRIVLEKINRHDEYNVFYWDVGTRFLTKSDDIYSDLPTMHNMR